MRIMIPATLRPKHVRTTLPLTADAQTSLRRALDTYAINTLAAHACVSARSLRRAAEGEALTPATHRLLNLALATLPSPAAPERSAA